MLTYTTCRDRHPTTGTWCNGCLSFGNPYNPSNCYRKEPKNMTDFMSAASSPDAPQAEGSPQSDLQHRFDLVDAPAMFEMTNILYKGEKKYGKDNWRVIEIEDHLNHMLAHIYAYLGGNRDDNHLANLMCRAMFAKGKEIMNDKETE